MIRPPTIPRPGRPAAAALFACLAGATALAQLGPSVGDEMRPAGEPLHARRQAEALIGLGQIQTELAEFESAEENFLSGIDILEAEDGEYSATLIEPYLSLARVYVQGERGADAVTVLEHVRHISQRNFGLFNLEQSTLLDELSRAYELAGETSEAHRIQRERLNLALRQFGPDDLRMIPYRYHLAEYYELSRMRASAAAQYQAVVEIQEARLGESDGALLEPLTELVRIDILLGRTTHARRRLTEVLELSENARALSTGAALAVLGDWEMSHQRPEAALDYYGRAYASLAAEASSLAADYFSKPVLIDFIPPASPVDRRGGADPHAWGAITAQFDVSAEGRASDIRVLAATPPGLMDTLYVRRLAESYFRPRLVAGEPVHTEAVRFEHRFRYYVDD